MAAESGRTALSPRVLAGAGLATIALGLWGFARLDDEPVPSHLYRTLQLFVLDSGGASGALPWQLEVARFAAVALTATSVGYLIVALSRSPVDGWRARRSRDHVIVCGLGALGGAAAVALRDAGASVVGIDVDAAASGVDRCRHGRIPVVVGDAADRRTLVRAGIGRAAHLLALTPTLESRGRVALAAAETAADRADGLAPLAIHLELADPRLAELFRAVELMSHGRANWRLEQLDLPTAGARAMLDEAAPWPADATDAHVLVVGDSTVGTALVRELRRRWHTAGSGGTLTVTVADDDPVASPLLPTPAADVEVIRVALTGTDHPNTLTSAYVCLDDETAGLAAALTVVGRHPGVPTVVRVERATAFGTLLERELRDLHPFSVDRHVLTPDALLGGQRERVAEALHDFYRRTTAEPGDPASAPWDRLAESLRTSNRAHAADIVAKLARVGLVLVPDDGAPPDRFTDTEIELLGELEHERWVAERRRNGWTPGPRDPIAKTTPYLVGWDELDESVRDIDRDFVAALPDILADAGLHLRRPARTANS